MTADPIEHPITEATDAGSTTRTEEILAEVLAGVVHAEHVAIDSHFFEDLGADSLVMAQFCARVRKRADVPPVSIKDVYQHPTIADLVASLAPGPSDEVRHLPAQMPRPGREQVPPTEPVLPHRASTSRYLLCGTLQLLLFLGTAYVAALIGITAYEWVTAANGIIDVYLRAVQFSVVIFLALCSFPILAKWVLIGRWKPQQIPVWSLAYLRFWIVKTLVRANPVVPLMVGSPLYGLYLRALGAKIGPGVAIFSSHVPVCTDLLTIGAGTVIRKDSFFTGYRAHAGFIETGSIVLGEGVVVGEATVIDIGTSLGDGAQLGHSSSLHTGQAVPEGERWHGSPAQRTEVDYSAVAPADCGAVRRAAYVIAQLTNVLLLVMPLALAGLAMLVVAVPQLVALSDPGTASLTSWVLYADVLATSLVLFFGSLLAGLLVVVTVPRALNLLIKPDKVYRLYGLHYGAHRTISRITNNRFLITLFGDSSFIVHYLRCLGYGLSPVVQTGSNFGTELKHESPFLVSVGRGTVIAGGLSIVNADFSSTSFRVSRASIGSNNFLGNWIAYPSQGRTGDNCLLATKVMVPIDRPVRDGVGLLGSPSFEIPRTVERDIRFRHMATGDDLPHRLAAKNKHNLITMGLFLLTRWFYTFVLTLVAFGTAYLYDSLGVAAVALAEVLVLVFSVLYFVLVERASTGFRPLRPTYCSIYEAAFWRQERFFKMESGGVYGLFNGTPFKGAIWRLLGVRVGKRLFDDGTDINEKNMVTLGDDVTLNAGTHVQCHSQEDFAFKSDHITIGAGCTVGVGALVHYGVTIGEGAVLAPASFLMKGEEMPAGASWGGNPAREMRDERWSAELPTTTSAPAWPAASNGHRTTVNGVETRW